MPLLGPAAMLLSFDVEASAIEEHDRWHTHEHFPERLSIPGFLRGTRWIAHDRGPRYMVLYEVESLETLSSEAYLSRLNDPTPWTTRMMPHYRGMNRGLCGVLGSFGLGQGGAAALIRCELDDRLQRRLLEETLPAIPGMPGLGSAHLLQGAQAATMTNEQRIRGADARIDAAVIVTGYDDAAVAECATRLAGRDGASFSTYRLSYSLSHAEVHDA